MKLQEILAYTNEQKYAVGSFSPRYIKMIKPVLQAAQENQSPIIVQISQRELGLYKITPKQFADEYFHQLHSLNITVPTTLHLDHTKEFDIIAQAIDAGFESVMIDASDKKFEENVAMTKRVVDYAHPRGVSVEAELGKIGANDNIETDAISDSELYTKPSEAKLFVDQTNVDALAVSVGTAHGVYTVRQPTIDYEIIRQIKSLTPTTLVLHGGSGVLAEMVIRSYQLENGGISKVNIATDLELAFLESIGYAQRGDNEWCDSLNLEQLEIGRDAVKNTVNDKMINYLHSDHKAW